jgi:hypothetical protein
MRLFVLLLLFTGVLGFTSVLNAVVTQKKAVTKAHAKKTIVKKADPKKQTIKKEAPKKEEVKKQKGGASFIGQYKDWAVQDFEDKGKKFAYMISSPKKSTGKYEKRGQAYLLISRQGDSKNGKDVVSFVAGYPYKASSAVEFIFQDNKKFIFFSQADRAWAPDDATDKAVIEAMKKGSLIKIKGKSSKDADIMDEISLAGFQAAYKVYLENNKL